MKRLLLLISVMLVMTSMVAQDIYTVGHYTPDGGSRTFAAVWKNGESSPLYNSAAGSGDNTSTAVTINPATGDVFWSRCNESYGDVMKNNSTFLNQGSGTYIHDIVWCGSSENSLRSAGYRKSGGKKYAAVWCGSDSNPLYSPGYENGKESEAYGVITLRTSNNGTATYFCGYLNNTETGDPRAVIWQGGVGVYFTLSNNNSYAYALTYYNANFYTVGLDYDGGVNKLKVWKNNIPLYTLVESNASQRADIYVDAGDVYVVSYGGSSPDIVWKNGVLLHSTPGYFKGVSANTNGVYCAGKLSSVGTIWKDGQVLYTINGCQELNAICIAPEECENGDTRTLPYFEGFENGETDWTCWTKTDVDNQNAISNGNYYQSYWDRSGHENNYPAPYAGDYCAKHNFGGVDQEGWLISPRLYLQPGRDYTELIFKSYELYPDYYDYEGVWISTTTTSPSAFTEIWSPNNVTPQWKDVIIDLAAYQGQAVYIAFKYTGADAHTWYIDNVLVSEDWTPGSGAYVPYYESFNQSTNQEPGYNWYILDNDHSGDGRNWKWNSSESCAYHPWGQQNMPQEGWMMSRGVVLDSGHNYMLSFRTKNSSSGPGMKSSVWITSDETGIPDPANYTTQLWEETSSSDWHTVNIDLSAYAGHTVRIGFKYEGTYAHNWYVDDFAIEENILQYNINVEANNPTWGTVTGGGVYEQGENVTITATPNEGYIFLQWTKDGNIVSNETSYSFTASEDATYVAVFGEPAVNYYTIMTDLSPVEAGWIDGAGIYAEGETVTLTAYTNMGWIFDEWSDGNTDNPRTITVTGDATYIGIFSQMTFTINVSAQPAEGGTVTGSGSYIYGEMVELTATPTEGYDFLNWENGETSLTRYVMVDGDADYTAYFAQQGVTTYTVTVLTNNPELGSVTGGGTFAEGTEISISATPIGYAHFVNWNDGSTKNPRTITVSQDITYTAIFEADQLYTITVTSADESMGTVSGGGNFPMGAEVTIQAFAKGGYYFNGWNDNDMSNPRVITVTGDATYTANFSAQQSQTFTLTVSCNPTQGAVTGNGTYNAGDIVQIQAIPYQGFIFEKWNDGNTDNPRTVTVNNNMTFVAFFKGEGVDEYGTGSIVLYPNPSNDVIRLQGIADNSEVRIYNTIGELVKVVNVSDSEAINVSDLSAGLYIVNSGNIMMKFTKE